MIRIIDMVKIQNSNFKRGKEGDIFSNAFEVFHLI